MTDGLRWGVAGLLLLAACGEDGPSREAVDAFFDANRSIDRVQCDCEPKGFLCDHSEAHVKERECQTQVLLGQDGDVADKVECLAKELTEARKCIEKADCSESLMDDCLDPSPTHVCGALPESLADDFNACEEPFVCKDGTKIDADDRCNLNSDCPDNSDEDCTSFGL